MSGALRFRAMIALLALPLMAGLAHAQLVIVSGLGGEPRFVKGFAELSTALATAAHERGKLPDAAITWLGDSAGPRSKWYRGAATKDNVLRVLARLAGEPGTDPAVVVLIGHGAGEGEETRVSLPGPDMNARDFARALAAFGKRPVAFVNLTSASGDMLPVLAAPGRVVVTATKSAFERNETQFGRYFVEALARDGADTDKDGRVSLLEAFTYAAAETKRFYETEGRLATEHAQIADESRIAGRFFFSAGGGAPATDARLAALYAERETLDGQIQALKSRKKSMTVEAYERELERLLLSLARKSREIRQVEGAPARGSGSADVRRGT